jgi:hypothetical protein
VGGGQLDWSGGRTGRADSHWAPRDAGQRLGNLVRIAVDSQQNDLFRVYANQCGVPGRRGCKPST